MAAPTLPTIHYSLLTDVPLGLQLFGGTLRNRCFSSVNASAIAAVAEGLGETSLL